MSWILITGATAGIGREAALSFARAGVDVIASGRDPARLASLEAEARTLGLALRTVVLDVTEAASVASAARTVDELTRGHGLDVLVNNAGFGEMAPLETISLARVRAMFETNVVGLARVTRAFLPAMRARGHGRVVNVSSLMGRMVVPAQGAYAASKHAVEALSDALRREVEPFGVSVVVVEPGAVDTGFTDIAFRSLDPVREDGEWAALAERMLRIESLYTQTSAKPRVISRVLYEAATTARPRPRYVAPLAAAAQLFASRVVPRGIFDAAMRGAMGLRGAGRVGPPSGAVRSRRGERRGSTSLGARAAELGRAREGARQPTETKLALITGAAGGIGSSAALRLAKRGFTVIATDRDEAALAKLARAGREARLSIEAQTMDVTDPASIARAAGLVDRRNAGRGLDVLVNNAGYAELGPIELASDEAWRAQLEVNVYGLLAVTQAFAPAMRYARRGRIVNVSSVAGLLAFPFMGVYSASKFAVEALTDALRLELGAFGVEVAAVQPSFIRSGFADRAKQTIARYRLDDSAYAPIADRLDAILGRMDAIGGEPEDVARAIERASTSTDPRARYQAPFSAKLAAAALPWVPSALEDRGLARMFELHRLHS